MGAEGEFSLKPEELVKFDYWYNNDLRELDIFLWWMGVTRLDSLDLQFVRVLPLFEERTFCLVNLRP